MSGTELVGRGAEFAELWDLFLSAREGRGCAALLLGEPGIGKTSLCAAVTERAQREGAGVSWGRCVEAGGQPAWWPFSQALAGWIEDSTLDGNALEAAGAAVLHILPEAKALLPDLEPLGAPEADTTAFAVARVATRLLRVAAARGPRVIVLDDLHAADPASLRLLSVLASEVRALPILILCTLRDAEARRRNDVRLLIDDVSRCGRVLHVSRLADDAARTLLKRAAPELTDEVQARAMRAAGGNPLFLIEVAVLLAAKGHVGGSVPVPVGVRETLRSRLAVLPRASRSLLEAVAVLGGEVMLERAAAVAGLASSEAAEAAVETGLLLFSAGGKVRLSHGLVREVVYGDIEPARRAALHVSAADTLAENPTPPDQLAEIARHLLSGGQDAAVRGVRTALRAAEVALRRAKLEDAIAVLETASRAIEVLEVPAVLRAELSIELGRVLMRVGRIEEGRECCEGARMVAEQLADADLVARAALARGSVLHFGHVDPDLVSALKRAAELRRGQGDALEARVLARLAGAEQPSFDTAGPIARAKQAIELARTLDDPETLLYVLHDGMSACMDFDHPAERRVFNSELRDLAKQSSEPWFELRALTRLVFDHADLGATAEADAVIDALDALARRFRHPQYQWPVLLLRAMRASFEGQFSIAERRVDEAIALGADDPRFRFTLFGHRHAALLAAERPSEALELVAAEGARVLDIVGGEFLLATLRVEAQTRLDDRDAVQHGLATAARTLDYQDPGITAIIAEAAAFAGDRELCVRTLPMLTGRGDWFATHGVMWCFVRDPLSRYAGLVSRALGELDEAVTHLEHAVGCLRRAKGHAFLARCLLDLGDSLRARGAPGDGERARDCLDEAAALARRLGQQGLSSRPEAQYPPTSPIEPAAFSLVPAATPFTLRCEGDFWSIERGARVIRLKDSRGIRILAQLVERPGEDVHVLDLVEHQSGSVDGGDAGELLDARARSAYRTRLIDLREELDEAERMADLGSLERLRAEAETLEAELSRAFAFGGRSRRTGAATERARSAVTRRVKETIRKIRGEDSELGAHLAFAVKTGVVCSYRPGVG